MPAGIVLLKIIFLKKKIYTIKVSKFVEEINLLIRTIKQNQSKYLLASPTHLFRIILAQLAVLELFRKLKIKNRLITIKVVLDLAFKANLLELLIQPISRKNSHKDLDSDLATMILQVDLITNHKLNLVSEVQITDSINNSNLKMDLISLISAEEAIIHLVVEEDEAVVEAEEEAASIIIFIMIVLGMEDFMTI